MWTTASLTIRERTTLGLVLDRKATPVRCTIHEIKPKVCRLFPIDERDLRDRDIIFPDAPCGFSFIPREEFLKQGGAATGPRRTGSTWRRSISPASRNRPAGAAFRSRSLPEYSAGPRAWGLRFADKER